MKKLQKRRAGFTLIEMLIVATIIIILASVAFISVTAYLGKAKSLNKDVSVNASTFASKNVKINDKFVDLGY